MTWQYRRVHKHLDGFQWPCCADTWCCEEPEACLQTDPGLCISEFRGVFIGYALEYAIVPTRLDQLGTISPCFAGDTAAVFEALWHGAKLLCRFALAFLQNLHPYCNFHIWGSERTPPNHFATEQLSVYDTACDVWVSAGSGPFLLGRIGMLVSLRLSGNGHPNQRPGPSVHR